MNSGNRYNGMDKYAIQRIRFKARQLSSLPCFGNGEIEDLEQELAINLHRRMPGFDPERSALNTFIDKIIETRAASLVAMAKAPSRYSGQPAISWEEMLDSGRADEAELSAASSFVSGGSDSFDVEIALDLGRCLQRLSEEQRRLCLLLPFHKPDDISRRMGWSRATFFRRVTTLRESLKQAGVGNFFVAA